MAVEEAVTVEPVGEFELKGIRRPIAAYNVLAAVSPILEPCKGGPTPRLTDEFASERWSDMFELNRKSA
jgi:hypothetical protein